jgi:hypothetical protein
MRSTSYESRLWRFDSFRSRQFLSQSYPQAKISVGNKVEQSHPPTAGATQNSPERDASMRMVTILIAALSVIALVACSGSDNDSAHLRSGSAGPYIGGAVGAGF